ncbi:MAG: hypothetical protein LKJ25_00450 [Clostridia bacterium]|jgi:hypothetical protein|nr:hypothetical protein [Clostridia bacterium]
MIELNKFRQKLIETYKYSQDRINLVLKFIGGLLFFFMLSSVSTDTISVPKKLMFVLLCAVITSFSSPGVFIVLCMVASTIFIATASVETAIIVFIVFFVLFLFYGRIFPKESLLFIVMLVGYKFKIPYAVPLFAAIYVGARSIVPVGAAVLFSQFEYCFDTMVSMSPTSGFAVTNLPDKLLEVFTYLCNEIYAHITGALFVMAAVLIALIIGWAISSLHIDHEKEIGMGIAAVITVFGVFVAIILGGANVSVTGMPISVVISVGIVLIIRLFDDLPDYKNTEWVQFQDSNYFYYVKAVPKIKAARNDDYSSGRQYRGDE